jgi:hypothetical protein
MKMKILTSFVLLGLSTGTALATTRPVVVELFTSQACSDCPPADALLRHVQAQDHDVLALDLHVTYWNGASWTDPYSLQSATDRQNYYAALQQSSEVYTPEAVVDGQKQFVGSDRDMMAAAIDQARTKIAAGGTVPVSINAGGEGLSVHVGRGIGMGTVWLFGFDPQHTTHVLGGENGGATLSEVNVVRSITRLGAWNGQPMVLNTQPPAGEKFAVLVQKPDGAILGAASN